MKPVRQLLPDRATLPQVLLFSLPLALIISRVLPPVPIPATTTLTTVRELRPVGRCCGPGCRERELAAQKRIDATYFASRAMLEKQRAEERDWGAELGTNTSAVVADLGAGGGHILATLNVSRRIAIEVNAQARAVMKETYPGMIEIVEYPEDLEDESVDVLLTTNAIQRFECPLAELREMGRKVKTGGRVFVGIKNEGPQVAIPVIEDDAAQHLYTWNRQMLYNLIKEAGFVVESIEPSDDELLAKALTWRTKEDLRSDSAYIYHWARGVKKLVSPRLY